LSHAQPAWPVKPITLIVPFAPGGIVDITARAVAQAMAKSLGRSIVIDNRPSAGSKELPALLDAEIKRWAGVIADAKIERQQAHGRTRAPVRVA
jgi:hypothetical protein